MQSKIKKKYIIILSVLAILAAAFCALIQIPKFSLEAANSVNTKVEVGTKFIDHGANLVLGKYKTPYKTYSEEKINTNAVGEYELTYEANLLWRKAKKTIKIEVVDTQKPRIELISSGNKTIPGKEYEEEGFYAYDNYDGEITDNVKIRVEGKKVYYRVEDSSGNVAEAVRLINYDDNTAPRIILNGESVLTIELGETFKDPGVTAIDNVDGDVTASVEATNNVNSNQLGTYNIHYVVSDNAGNVATADRKVIVANGYSVPIKGVNPNGKIIYLTFDDGPSEHTPRLLNILKKYNVKATFFVVGSGNMSYLDDIARDGHSIGLHTMTHDYAKIYSNEDIFMKEITQLRRIVYNKTGIDTTMIRFPGGSSNTISKHYKNGVMSNLVNIVTAQGYQYYDWNVTSGDAGEVNTAWSVYNNVVSGVKYQKQSIVLQHDTKGFSVDATEDIIKWGLSNGYTFKKLTPYGYTVHHPVNN